MNAQKTTFLAMLAGFALCFTAANVSAQTYAFPNNSQGWQYMGPYDGGSLTPLADFVTAKNPWTGVDGDGGALLLGQEGFVMQSPTGSDWAHCDLNSPDLAYAYKSGRFLTLSYDITGSHMTSNAGVQVQAVIVVRQPNEISDRRYRSDFHVVPLGDNGAWETFTEALMLPAGTIVKKINLRVFVETASLYEGWIMVDNVVLR